MNPNEIINSLMERSIANTPNHHGIGHAKNSLVGLRSKKLPGLDEDFEIGSGEIRQPPGMSNEYTYGGFNN
jgi:hypothetical protein